MKRDEEIELAILFPQAGQLVALRGRRARPAVALVRPTKSELIFPLVPTPVEIAPARGKLGILLVGLGAVSTTTIAGVFAIRKGLAKPIGSLTQMGTIRLGKRTEGRSP